MKITSIRKAAATVVQIAGSVDSLTSEEAQSFFDAQIGSDHTRLVADLSQVEYLSSAGLRVLLSAMKSTRQRGGDLYLAGLQENVRQVLDLAGFTSIFKIFSTVEEALDAFLP
ncbi:MAG: STAS domain-containing protein [Chloroflexi bacterium]|nr:STAS domain-containing protein [Chloroflexota bacterium]